VDIVNEMNKQTYSLSGKVHFVHKAHDAQKPRIQKRNVKGGKR